MCYCNFVLCVISLPATNSCFACSGLSEVDTLVPAFIAFAWTSPVLRLGQPWSRHDVCFSIVTIPLLCLPVYQNGRLGADFTMWAQVLSSVLWLHNAWFSIILLVQACGAST